MNKKGFTLVELLAVISVLAILTMIAVPNVMSTINNNRKNTFLLDAKRMISKAKSIVASDKQIRDYLKGSSRNSKKISFDNLNEKNEFKTDADGGEFVADNTWVKVTYVDDEFKYCIRVEGSKKQIVLGENGCVNESALTGIDVVKDK